MKGRFLKKHSTRLKKLVVPALVYVMGMIAVGTPITEVQAMEFLNTTDQVVIYQEVADEGSWDSYEVQEPTATPEATPDATPEVTPEANQYRYGLPDEEIISKLDNSGATAFKIYTAKDILFTKCNISEEKAKSIITENLISWSSKASRIVSSVYTPLQISQMEKQYNDEHGISTPKPSSTVKPSSTSAPSSNTDYSDGSDDDYKPAEENVFTLVPQTSKNFKEAGGEFKQMYESVSYKNGYSRFDNENFSTSLETFKKWCSPKYAKENFYGDKRYDSSLQAIGIGMTHGQVYWLPTYVQLRKGVEEIFTLDVLYDAKERMVKVSDGKWTYGGLMVTDLPMPMHLAYTPEFNKIFNENKDKLAQLAVDAGITTANDKNAAYATMFAYYGIINNEYSTADIKYNPSKKCTRQDFYTLFGKFGCGWSTLDYAANMHIGYKEHTVEEIKADDKNYWVEEVSTLDPDLDAYASAKRIAKNLNNNYKKWGYTKFKGDAYLKYNWWGGVFSPFYSAFGGNKINVVNKSKMKSSNITRIEVMQILGASCFSRLWNPENEVKVSSTFMKKTIKDFKLSSNPAKYLKESKKIMHTASKTNGLGVGDEQGYSKYLSKRLDARTKQLSYTQIQSLARCYKKGLIKPTGNWKSDIYGTVTESQAIYLLYQAAYKCPDCYLGWAFYDNGCTSGYYGECVR